MTLEFKGIFEREGFRKPVRDNAGNPWLLSLETEVWSRAYAAYLQGAKSDRVVYDDGLQRNAQTAGDDAVMAWRERTRLENTSC